MLSDGMSEPMLQPGRRPRKERHWREAIVTSDAASRDTNEATTSNLVRFAGLAGAHEGIVFAGTKPIHPPDVVDSVNTSTWATTTPLKTAMRMLLVRV